MSVSEKKSKAKRRGKYQLLMQGIILMLVFGASFIALILVVTLFYQSQSHDWTERQQRTAWYERDGFRTRIRLVHTEIEALSADPSIQEFGRQESAYAYPTIRAFRKLTQNTTFFTSGASSLALTTGYPDARVVTASGTMSKQEFFRNELRLTPDQSAAFSAFFAKKGGNFFRMALYNDDGTFREMTRCLRRNTQGYDLFFISRLKPSFFVQNPNIPFMLIDADGSVAAESSLRDAPSEELMRTIHAGQEMLSKPAAGDEAVILKPTRSGFHIIMYRLPDTTLTLVLRLTSSPVRWEYGVMVTLAFVPFFALAAFYLSRRISRRLYKPIEIALEPLENAPPRDQDAPRDARKAEAPARLDEVELITQRLQNYRRIADDLTALRHEHATYRDLAFYQNILEGVVLPGYKDSPLMRELDAGKHTVVILAFAENEEAEALVLHQEVQTAFAEDPNCRLLTEGALRFVMIYTDTPQARAAELVRKHLAEIGPKLPWYAAFSETREGAKALEQSYRECLLLMDFRYRSEQNHFLFAKDLPGIHSSYYYYPVSEEQRLTRLIVAGDEDALGVFDKLWRDNTVQRALGAEARRSFVLALVNTLRRSAQELKVNLNQLPAVRHDLADMIEKHWQEPEVGADIRDLLTALIRYQTVRGSSEDEIMKEKMYSFIAQNYYDDIMLNDLADYLGLTPKYCSALFARLLETNFKEYLNRYRITQATRILHEDPDILVNDLAATVGFNSANSFIRVFRQYTGTTPGRYMKEK